MAGGRGFIEDIRQADPGNIFNAILGGIIFNASNILLVAAMAIAGMAVAFPVGVGIALALGVIINYIFAPQGKSPASVYKLSSLPGNCIPG